MQKRLLQIAVVLSLGARGASPAMAQVRGYAIESSAGLGRGGHLHGDGPGALYLINVDGTGLVRLTPRSREVNR